MEIFKGWRRVRSTDMSDPPKEVVGSERSSAPPVVAASGQRGRRPSTMGKRAAEQTYLANVAQRAKQAR